MQLYTWTEATNHTLPPSHSTLLAARCHKGTKSEQKIISPVHLCVALNVAQLNVKRQGVVICPALKWC